MSEWKIYKGTDEQIEEIFNAGGYVYKNEECYESNILMAVGKREELVSELNDSNVIQYLICKPHPLAGMIKRWADTGQPVFWKSKKYSGTGICSEYFPPFAYPDEFEYSFQDFSEDN